MGEESDIQRACMDWLKARGILHWRCELGGVRRAGGRRGKNAMKGFPDIGGAIGRGHFFVIEVKAPDGRLKPEQIEWRDRLISQGCLYILARSIDDLEASPLAEAIKYGA